MPVTSCVCAHNNTALATATRLLPDPSGTACHGAHAGQAGPQARDPRPSVDFPAFGRLCKGRGGGSGITTGPLNSWALLRLGLTLDLCRVLRVEEGRFTGHSVRKKGDDVRGPHCPAPYPRGRPRAIGRILSRSGVATDRVDFLLCCPGHGAPTQVGDRGLPLTVCKGGRGCGRK